MGLLVLFCNQGPCCFPESLQTTIVMQAMHNIPAKKLKVALITSYNQIASANTPLLVLYPLKMIFFHTNNYIMHNDDYIMQIHEINMNFVQVIELHLVFVKLVALCVSKSLTC